ncbi:MAG TPA: VOC family protein [Microlunatus sp.]|nr:VOC family protein [Microlunatus sp.]
MTAIGRLHHAVFDTAEPVRDARFWSALLGWPITYTSPDWVVVAISDQHSGLAFQLAPDHRAPQWGDPARPQQMHFDVMVDSLATAEERVVQLGARLLADRGSVWADPSGHPFCLIPRPDWAPPICPGD